MGGAGRASPAAQGGAAVIPLLEKATALRATTLFARMSPEELMTLAGLAEEENYDGGEVVFAEGHPADALYIVVQGTVLVQGSDGAASVKLLPGECFGEMSLLDEERRSATVLAESRSELLRIDRDDFLDILSIYPVVAQALLEVLARRLRGKSPEAG